MANLLLKVRCESISIRACQVTRQLGALPSVDERRCCRRLAYLGSSLQVTTFHLPRPSNVQGNASNKRWVGRKLSRNGGHRDRTPRDWSSLTTASYRSLRPTKATSNYI